MSRRQGVVGSWADGHLLLHMLGLGVPVRSHAFWGSSKLLWFLAAVLDGGAEWTGRMGEKGK